MIYMYVYMEVTIDASYTSLSRQLAIISTSSFLAILYFKVLAFSNVPLSPVAFTYCGLKNKNNTTVGDTQTHACTRCILCMYTWRLHMHVHAHVRV